MIKVVKFGGSSLASAGQIAKVGDIIRSDESRKYVVPSAPGKRNAKDTKGMLIAAGMGCLIAYQTFINVGVATGVIPNTGLPLPFISTGLRSLISLFGGMGFVLNVSLQRVRQ